jgi:hypothetical protein
LNAHKSLAFWLGIAFGALLLALALRSVDLAAMSAALSAARLWWALPFVALLAGFYALKAARWSSLLAPVAKVPFRLSFRAVIVGYASNALLPAQLGDIVRALMASREMGLRLAPVLTTLLVERALDLAVVVGLLGAVVVLRPDVVEGLRIAGAMVAAFSVASLLLLYAYGRHPSGWIDAARRLTAWLPARLQERFAVQVRAGADGASALASPGRFAGVVAMSIAKWVLIAGCNLISLVALNVDVPLAAAILVLACTVLALLLPTAPGYVGAIQIAYVLALAPFGVSATEAVAASLFFHALSFASVVLAGWYYLHASGYRLADLRSEVAGADRPAA